MVRVIEVVEVLISIMWRIFFGGGGGSTHSPTTGIRLVLFYDIPFRPTNLKIFLNVPSAPTYAKFEGSARQKNAIFWSTFFQMASKNAFFGFCSKIQLLRNRRRLSYHLLHFVSMLCKTGSCDPQKCVFNLNLIRTTI